MSYKLVVTSVAQLDIRDTLDHYLKIKPTLALEFYERIEASYERLENNPQFYSYFYKSEVLRSLALEKFPYSLIFQIKADEVFIMALHNQKSDPEKVLNRI